MSGIWKIVISIVITAAVVGGGAYYYLGQVSADQKNSLESKVSDLQDQVKGLQDKLKDDALKEVSESDVVEEDAEDNKEQETTKSSELYTNADFGFSFEVPNGYRVEKADLYEGMRAVKMDISKVADGILSESIFTTLMYFPGGYADLADLEATKGEFKNDVLETSDITIGGAEGHKYKIGGLASGYYAFAVKGGQAFDLEIYPDTADGLTAFNKIVETFKFAK